MSRLFICIIFISLITHFRLVESKSKKIKLMKDGFYKIESLADGSVLTATWTGRPRQVETDSFKELSAQEWRIRTVFERNNEPLQIVRNEDIKDNEVTKEEGDKSKIEGKVNFVPIYWKFLTPAGNTSPNTYVLSHGSNCLKSNGRGNRISFEECNKGSKEQQWHFEFLYDNNNEK